MPKIKPTDVNSPRAYLLLAIATMPDQALEWIAHAIMHDHDAGTPKGCFPESLGGFEPDAQRSIVAAKGAAKLYIRSL